jgi:hypothetical protein
MQTKRCSRCKEAKPVSEFHRRGDRWQSECKPCRKISNAAFYQRTKHKHNGARYARKARVQREFVAWVISLKAGKPCTDCKRVYHPAAMQWDHLPGTEKVASIANLAKHGNREAVLAEIAKCELVCANCHAIRTWERLIEEPASVAQVGRAAAS